MFGCCPWQQPLPPACAVFFILPGGRVSRVPGFHLGAAVNLRAVWIGPTSFGPRVRCLQPCRFGGASGAAMVVLHVKRGDESQFLLQAPGSTELEELTAQVARIYNGRLKVHRLCTGTEREDGGCGGRARGCEDWGRYAVAWDGKGASGLTRDERPNNWRNPG